MQMSGALWRIHIGQQAASSKIELLHGCADF